MSEGKNKVEESPADRTLKLTRVFHAPRRLVFEACTKREHLDQWMMPHGFQMQSCGVDLREGGKWHCLMVSPDGEDLPHGGTYEKIVPDELLVMTHSWVGDDGQPEHWTRITMRFEDSDEGRTKLSFKQSIFKSIDSRNNHDHGWTQCLDKLEGLLARLQPEASHAG